MRALIMHLSPEATVGTSRPFNLAIIQRLLLVRLVHYSIAGNVARCVSSGGIRFIVPRDIHSYAFVAQRVRDTRTCACISKLILRRVTGQRLHTHYCLTGG